MKISLSHSHGPSCCSLLGSPRCCDRTTKKYWFVDSPHQLSALVDEREPVCAPNPPSLSVATCRLISGFESHFFCPCFPAAFCQILDIDLDVWRRRGGDLTAGAETVGNNKPGVGIEERNFSQNDDSASHLAALRVQVTYFYPQHVLRPRQSCLLSVRALIGLQRSILLCFPYFGGRGLLVVRGYV